MPNGLRSVESPAWGGWGGRYVNVRGDVWMDAPPATDWRHPGGRFRITSMRSKKLKNVVEPNAVQMRTQYVRPIWRWLLSVQNDLATRTDWCVTPYAEANHPLKVVLAHAANLGVQVGETAGLSASGSRDPDGDRVTYQWWCHPEAGTCPTEGEISDADQPTARCTIPKGAATGATIHAVCEVPTRACRG